LATPVSRGARPIPCCRHHPLREATGQLEAIGGIAWGQLWAVRKPSAAPCSRRAGPIRYLRPLLELLWGKYGPSRYWRRPFRGELGQFHAVGITSLEKLWANSKPSAVPLGGSSGPSGGHRQHLAAGQPHAIGSSPLKTSWANSGLLLGPLWGDHGPSRYLQRLLLWEQGQFHDDGIASLEKLWANSKPSVAPLGGSSGPSGGHRQHLTAGQPHAIALFATPISIGAGPVP
jgi:hypothetical protein